MYVSQVLRLLGDLVTRFLAALTLIVFLVAYLRGSDHVVIWIDNFHESHFEFILIMVFVIPITLYALYCTLKELLGR